MHPTPHHTFLLKHKLFCISGITNLTEGQTSHWPTTWTYECWLTDMNVVSTSIEVILSSQTPSFVLLSWSPNSSSRATSQPLRIRVRDEDWNEFHCQLKCTFFAEKKNSAETKISKISRQFIQLITQFVKNALKRGRGREINPTLAVNKVTLLSREIFLTLWAVMAAKFTSLDSCLEKHLPAKELEEVKRILYGKPVR